MDGLKVNLLPGIKCHLGGKGDLIWEEYEEIAGYSIAVCYFTSNEQGGVSV